MRQIEQDCGVCKDEVIQPHQRTGRAMKPGDRSLCPQRPGLSSTPRRPQTYPWISFPTASVRRKMDDKMSPGLSVLTAAKPIWGKWGACVKGIIGPASPAFSFIHHSHRQHQLRASPSSKPSCPPPSSPILCREAISTAKSSNLAQPDLQSPHLLLQLPCYFPKAKRN